VAPSDTIIPSYSLTLGEQDNPLGAYRAGRAIIAESLGHDGPPPGQIVHLGLAPTKIRDWLAGLGLVAGRITVFNTFETDTAQAAAVQHLRKAVRAQGLADGIALGDLVGVITGSQPPVPEDTHGQIEHYPDIQSIELAKFIPAIGDTPDGLAVMLIYMLDGRPTIVSAWHTQRHYTAYAHDARRSRPIGAPLPFQTPVPVAGIFIATPGYDSRRDQPQPSNR
jgi:hypothetical protein